MTKSLHFRVFGFRFFLNVSRGSRKRATKKRSATKWTLKCFRCQSIEDIQRRNRERMIHNVNVYTREG